MPVTTLNRVGGVHLDRANVVGVLPAHDGRQIQIVGGTSNATTTIYTVPVGFELRMTHAHILDYGTATGARIVYSVIKTDAGVTQWYLFYTTYFDYTDQQRLVVSYDPALVLPAGYYINERTNAATVSILGSYLGYLVAV